MAVNVPQHLLNDLFICHVTLSWKNQKPEKHTVNTAEQTAVCGTKGSGRKNHYDA